MKDDLREALQPCSRDRCPIGEVLEDLVGLAPGRIFSKTPGVAVDRAEERLRDVLRLVELRWSRNWTLVVRRSSVL